MWVSEYQIFFSHNPFCCLYLIRAPARRFHCVSLRLLKFVSVRECECERGASNGERIVWRLRWH